VRREGPADEAPLHAFETVRAGPEAHVLAGAVTRSVAQDPFGALAGWRSRRPRLPHLCSLPRSRLELHAPSITTVQDPRRTSAYSEDVMPARRSAFREGSACSLPAIVKYVRFERVTIVGVGTLDNTYRGPRDECGVGARVPG